MEGREGFRGLGFRGEGFRFRVPRDMGLFFKGSISLKYRNGLRTSFDQFCTLAGAYCGCIGVEICSSFWDFQQYLSGPRMIRIKVFWGKRGFVYFLSYKCGL